MSSLTDGVSEATVCSLVDLFRFMIYFQIYVRHKDKKGKLGKRKENKILHGFLSYQHLILWGKKKKKTLY